MTIPINISIHAPGSDHIYRPHLVDKLNLGLTRKLIILTAPAGYGKTALLGEWVEQLDIPVVWLNMTEADNNMDRAYARFNEGMAAVFPGFEVEVPKPVASLLEAETYESVFMDAIFELKQEFVVVMDNYHVTSHSVSARVMEHLLDVMPPFMHWVLVTRKDLPFPITRMRAEGEILELDANDLRFSQKEARAFFSSTRGLSLASESLDHLYKKTDGWIGLMQLAALSIEKNAPEDQDRYVHKITAHNTYIQDYFSEEIFSIQDDTVKEFLLKTSVLRKINTSLASHIMSGQDVSDIQRYLINCGLLIPAGFDGVEFQYHQLFAYYLLTRFFWQYGMDEMRKLHRQASTWYESRGLLADAVNHAFAALDMDLTTRLLNTNTQEIDLSEYLTWQRWFVELPETILRDYPDVCMRCASSFYLVKDFDHMNHLLAVAEQVWQAQNRQDRLAEVNLTRGLAAVYLRQYNKVVKYATHAVQNAPDTYNRGSAHHVLGAGLFYMGKLMEAEEHIVKGQQHLLDSQDVYSAQIATAMLARIRASQGKLHEAANIHREVSEYSDPKVYEQAVAAHIYLGQLHYEWNELELARTYLLKALGQSGARYSGRHWPEAHIQYAQVLFAMGQEQESWAELCQAMTIAHRLNYQLQARHARSMQTRLEIRKGNLVKAIQWEDEAPSLHLKINYDYALTPEYLTMARLMIARLQHGPDPTLYSQGKNLLSHLQSNALDNNRMAEVIECHILMALLHNAADERAQAIDSLGKALELAQPEGYVRIFIDEGEPLHHLLEQAQTQGISPDYTAHLITEYDRSAIQPDDAPDKILTEREIEVLRLISQGLTAKEIAETLVVSWHTVRTHTKNIYCKLEVNNRLQAVERAELLNLL